MSIHIPLPANENIPETLRLQKEWDFLLTHGRETLAQIRDQREIVDITIETHETIVTTDPEIKK